MVHVLRQQDDVTEILLFKRNKGNKLDNYWLHIAGGIEGDEKAWQTAIRELHEETGLTAERFYSANHCEQFYSVYDDAVVLLPMFVAFVLFEAKITLDHEHSDCRWFSIEEALEIAVLPNHRECLRVVKENFIDRPPADFLRVNLSSRA